MQRKDIQQILIKAAVCYLIPVFVGFLVLQIASLSQIYVIFDTVADWVKLRAPENVAELFRAYGRFLLANLELVAVVLLLFPASRLIGAILGLLVSAAIISIQLFTPLGIRMVIDQQGGSDGGVVFVLVCGALLACMLIIGLSLTGENVRTPTMSRPAPRRASAHHKTPAADNVAPAPEFPAGEIPFASEATTEVYENFYQMLFGLNRHVRGEIVGDHQRVLERAQARISSLPNQRQYFPRRPMIIPKLIRAVNNEDSSKRELVEVIGQDPVLAGELLKVANSPFYRISGEPVESIGRAIILLGMDGLKALTSTLVMQPLVRVHTNYFPGFSANIWLQAVSSAEAAQVYARKTLGCDSFSAHLLGLISSIGYIVIFQMTTDIYKEFSGIRPNEAVFKYLCDHYGDSVSAAVVEEWGLSEEFAEILRTFQNGKPVNSMSTLARSLYYGRLCGTLHMLYEAKIYNLEQVESVTEQQRLQPEVRKAIWQSLESDETGMSDIWGNSDSGQPGRLETGV